MKISVLIPAFNEEHNIEETIKGIKKSEHKFDQDTKLSIVVIDDGSSDKTYEKARQTGVEVIRLDENVGKGGALNHGMKMADGDIVVFLDADLKESSHEFYKLVLPIIKGDADAVIAKFKPVKTKGGFGLVKGLAFYGVRLFTGEKVTCALSGQRAFKREILEEIGRIPDGYGLEVGMLIDILKKGYKVKEVEVDMYHDVTGRNIKGFMHRGKQFFDILKVLLKKIGERKQIA
ncbi:MAG TPA: glycosyltransferase family 2 protein [Thermoanaerobacterales bacterium]|nr:glycosyltransferase family 2 protein [Thermoanaerobacterales bacterium]